MDKETSLIKKRETTKEWHKKHPEYMSKWRKEHLTESHKKIKIWKKLNREKVREQQKRYYHKNFNRLGEYYQRWSEEHLEYQKNWRKKHLDKVREHNHRRKLKNLIGQHNESEWEYLCEKFNNKCVRCRKQFPIEKLTRDHIIPITWEGSSDYIDNIQPLCKSCNSKKHNTFAIDYTYNLRHK